MAERDEGLITRRSFLASLAALVATPPLVVRASGATSLPVRGLNHLGLRVSDLARSLEFYQGLFGMPVQARQGSTRCLRIGDGPQFVALAQGGASARPEIHHFGLAIDSFDAKRAMQALASHGVRDAPASVPPYASVSTREQSLGGAPNGTAELFLGDPDGIVVQLQDTRYCGGAGVLGSDCPSSLEPAPKSGVFALRGINHFTVFVADPERSMAFYQRVFGMTITTTQGSMPLVDVGTGGQILGFVGGGQISSRAHIHHACLTIDDFQHERVLEQLASYGVKTRPDPLGGPIAPLSAYVTMRMPERGGAPEGTPELYFTDPDGILIQLQDPSYCGGSGYLGEVCAYI